MFLVQDYLKKAHKKADKHILKMQRYINRKYDLQYLILKRLIIKLLKKYEIVWDNKLKELNSGLITKEEYQKYMINNILLSKEWKTINNRLIHEITRINSDIIDDLNKSMVEIYVDNYNAMTNTLKGDIYGK